MATSRHLRISRLAIDAGVKTPLYPLVGCHHVALLNLTAGNVEVHSTDENDTEYLVIKAGFERQIPGDRLLRPEEEALWVKAAVSGTVVILWY